MTTRVLPPSDLFAACPLDGEILEFYAGTFEAVYVSLSPFMQLTGLNVDELKSGTYANRVKVVANCKPVSWAEVARLAGLPSLAAVDIALRTRIGGLKKELKNIDFALAIDTLIETNNIVPPNEGCFPDLLRDRVLQEVQALGYEWVWVGDEFCTERKLHWIDDLVNQERELTASGLNVFTPDKQLLWTIHWDSHFLFLCSSRANLLALQQTSGLEGFFATETTEVYWSVFS